MASDHGCALITGASSGIGAAFAERLSKDGFSLVLVARRKDRLDELAKRLGRAEVLPADLTRPADLERVEERIAKGDLTRVINNAGVSGYGPFAELPLETIEGLIDLHIRAVARLTRAALGPMLARKTGAVINVASLLALSGTLPPKPMPYRAMYGGAKAFMLAFTQLVSSELAGTGVSAQICLPGLVETEFHGANAAQFKGRAMSAQDVVQASLTALARGEPVCIPGLDEPSAFEKVSEAQRAVLNAANRPALAARYRAGG